MLVLICAGLLTALLMRSPFRVDVVRDRGTLSRIVDDGWVENVYRLQLMNATESPLRLRIQASGLPRMAQDQPGPIALAAAEARWVAMAVRVPPEVAAEAGAGSHPIRFVVGQLGDTSAATGRQVVEKSTFMVPR